MSATRVLSIDQLGLSRRASIHPVTMVKLTTFLDRELGTTDKVFYFSDLPVKYKYDGIAVQFFWPVLAEGTTDYVSDFNHLASPNNVAPFFQRMTLALANSDIAGERISTQLRKHRMEGASIEFSELYLDNIDEPFTDLTTSHAGTEHTVYFRGRVDSIEITDETVQLFCTTRLPSMADQWIYLDDRATNDPLDHGLRVPHVYGQRKRVPGLGWEVGATTTFVQELDASETGNKEVTDSSGFPPTVTVVAQIGDEKMNVRAQAATPTILEIVTRGVGGSSASVHGVGEFILELITTATWLFNDDVSDALVNLYVENPINNEILRLDPGEVNFQVDTSDTGTVSGRTVTSVKFSAADLEALVEFFQIQAADAQVDTQPEFDSPSNDTVRAPLTAKALQDPAFEPIAGNGPGGSLSFFGSQSSIPFLNINSTDSDTEGILLWVPTGAAPSPTRTVNRFRIVVAINIDPNNTTTTTLKMNGDFYARNTVTNLTLTGGGATQLGITLVSAWQTPFSASPDVDEIERSGAPTASTNVNFVSLYMDAAAASTSNGAVDVLADSSYVEIELDPENLTRTTDTVVSGGGGTSVGFGLRFFADIDGIRASGPGYSVPGGTLIERPCDIIKHWVETVGGEVFEAASHAAILSAMPSNLLAFDARGFGFEWAIIMARIGYESRANIVPDQTSTGREWRALSADINWGFGDAEELIQNYQACTDGGRAISDLQNSFQFRYDHDPQLGDGNSEQSFRGTVVANDTTSDVAIDAADIALAVSAYGRLDRGPEYYLGIGDTATAEEIAGYTVQERSAVDRSVFQLSGVPWYEAIQHRVGDTARIVPGWRRTFDPQTREVRRNDQIWRMRNQATNWTAVSSVLDDAVVQGLDCLEVKSVVGSVLNAAKRDETEHRNIRGRAMTFWSFVTEAVHDNLDEDIALQVLLGTETDFTSDFIGYTISKEQLFPDIWQKHWIDLESAPDPTLTDGSYRPDRTIAWQFGWNQDSDLVDEKMFFRYVELTNYGTPCRIIGMSKNLLGDQGWGISAVEIDPLGQKGVGPVPPPPPTPPITFGYVQTPVQIFGGSERSAFFVAGIGNVSMRDTVTAEGVSANDVNQQVELYEDPGTDVSPIIVEFDTPPEAIGSEGQTVEIFCGTRITSSSNDIEVSVGASDTGPWTVLGDTNMNTSERIIESFTFFTTNTGNFFRFQDDGGAGSLNCHIGEIRRSLPGSPTPQLIVDTPISTDGDGTNLDNAIDGDVGTFASLDSSVEEHIEITFADPAFIYEAEFFVVEWQTTALVEVYASATRTTDPITQGVETVGLENTQRTAGVIAGIPAKYSIYHDGNTTNVFRIYANDAASVETKVHTVSRTLIRYVGPILTHDRNAAFWSVQGGTAVDEDVIFTEGRGSMKLTADGISTTYLCAADISPSEDFSSTSGTFKLRVNEALFDAIAAAPAVTIKLSLHSGDTSFPNENKSVYFFDKDDLGTFDTFATLTIADTDSEDAQGTNGAAVLTAVTRVTTEITVASSGGDHIVYWDAVAFA